MSYIENVKSCKKCSGYPIEKIFNSLPFRHLPEMFYKNCDNRT